jgi:curved DNA-binding protein
MPFVDYYKILNIKLTATESEIKKSYGKLAFKYHPDKNLGDLKSAAKFREIKEAYEILCDRIKRKIFDNQYEEFYYKAQAQSKPVEDDQKQKMNLSRLKLF